MDLRGINIIIILSKAISTKKWENLIDEDGFFYVKTDIFGLLDLVVIPDPIKADF